jgi:phospholipid transport system transporter-binding protein
MKLPPNVTMDEAPALAGQLPPQARAGSGTLEVDASALQVFDSAAIALLLELRRTAEAAGRGFQVLGAPAKLVELAQLYGVDSLLALSSPESARTAVAASPRVAPGSAT